jgi:hypothetical protein
MMLSVATPLLLLELLVPVVELVFVQVLRWLLLLPLLLPAVNRTQYQLLQEEACTANESKLKRVRICMYIL